MTLLTLVCGLALAGPPGQVHPDDADWGWSSEQTSFAGEADTGLVVATPAAALVAGSDPLYERLLGEDDETSEGGPTTLARADLGDLPWWLLGAAGLSAIAFFLSRKRHQLLTREPPATTLTVTCRTSLGATSGLAVVELLDDGWTRRFLVGTGGGAPTLLADLDLQAPQADLSLHAPPIRDDLPEPGEALGPREAAPAFAARYQEMAAALHIAPDEVEERRQRARGLIAAALANRRERRAS